VLHSSYCFVFKPINYDDYLAAYSFPINYNNEIIGTCIPVTVDGWDSLLRYDKWQDVKEMLDALCVL